MGKLTIEGNAERKVEADHTIFTLTFKTKADSSAKAAKNVYKQCEEFLKIITQKGVKISQIRFVEDSIDESYFDDKKTYIAEREIEIRIQYNMRFNNCIIEIIQDNEYNIELDTRFELSRYNEIHEELLKEAIQNSKAKATMIAEVMGQKIVGIDTVNWSGDCDSILKQEPILLEEMVTERPMCLSDKLEAPIKTEKEDISVVWIIE